MSLADSDRELVVDELGREPTPAEAALFETSGASTVRTAPQDRCSRPSTARASRSSSGRATTRRWSRCREARTGTTARTSRWVSRATTSPSYVDPFDGAATGVGGIVRDTLSMDAYPIVLADSLYFGEFDREPENEESQKRRIELRDIDQ